MSTNRIAEAIARYRSQISGVDNKAAIRQAWENSNLDFSDWMALGDIATKALMANVLTVDEANTLYFIHRDRFNTHHTEPDLNVLAERVVFMQTASELHRAGVI